MNIVELLISLDMREARDEPVTEMTRWHISNLLE